jgi:hypothetical protein
VDATGDTKSGKSVLYGEDKIGRQTIRLFKLIMDNLPEYERIDSDHGIEFSQRKT